MKLLDLLPALNYIRAQNLPTLIFSIGDMGRLQSVLNGSISFVGGLR